ncbi:CPBP family intramembrane metalloprotease [bacterium]|nr:CPBP family intramembrane metalloprotease [bacterium]
MNETLIGRIGQTLSFALVIFITAVLVPKLFFHETITIVLVTQTLELVLALLAIVILGKAHFSRYGFCRPKPFFNTSLLGSVFLAFMVGALASLAILLLGAERHSLLKSLSFPQIILLVWIFSSIIEEIFTRGFLQGHLAPFETIKVLGPVSLPTLISAAFFGLMHSVLLLSGTPIVTTGITILFTFTLGLLAGHQFSRSRSLVPPIIVHFCGNVGGFLGGLIYVMTSLIITGQVPSF